MSKSEGNFYTLRDLLLKGHRASAIRFLLLSVPYRHQMNFTFDGLAESTNAIERLRTFARRVEAARQSAASEENAELAKLVNDKRTAYRQALSSDLNTAEARAAVFDVVRAGNIALDSGAYSATNLDSITAILQDFDAVFDVLNDRDAAITRSAIDWAQAEGRAAEIAPELQANLSLSDEAIEALIAERTEARRKRNFARGDAIRKELLEKGVILEDGKDGVSWKRK